MLILPDLDWCSVNRRWNRPLAAVALFAVLQFLSLVAAAQVPVADDPVETDGEKLLKAETDLQLLNSHQFVRNEMLVARRAEARLKSILQRDPNSPFRFQVEQQLDAVGEILGAHNLAIATFYSKRSHGLKGAQGRLLAVVRDCPHFSRMDEVLILLADVSLRDERPEEAAAYLKQLISNYPLSSLLPRAFDRLSEIEASSWEGNEKSEHR